MRGLMGNYRVQLFRSNICCSALSCNVWYYIQSYLISLLNSEFGLLIPRLSPLFPPPVSEVLVFVNSFLIVFEGHGNLRLRRITRWGRINRSEARDPTAARTVGATEPTNQSRRCPCAIAPGSACSWNGSPCRSSSEWHLDTCLMDFRYRLLRAQYLHCAWNLRVNLILTYRPSFNSPLEPIINNRDDPL